MAVEDRRYPLRIMTDMQSANDGTRTIAASMIVPEVADAIMACRDAKLDAVLIGAAAVSYYCRPRYTDNADFLFFAEAAIPRAVSGFRIIRPHTFSHVASDVEVKAVSAAYLRVPQTVVGNAIASASTVEGLRIASPSGLVALMLFRLAPIDKADIVALLLCHHIDVLDFGLPADQLHCFHELVACAEEERKRPALGD